MTLDIFVLVRNSVVEWLEVFPQALKSEFSYAKHPDGNDQNNLCI